MIIRRISKCLGLKYLELYTDWYYVCIINNEFKNHIIMQLTKSINFVSVSFTNKEANKFELFDMVNTIGLELTKSSKSGLLLDLFGALNPEEILDTVKSGLRSSFPLLPSLYLAYTPCKEKKNKCFDSGFITKCFDHKNMAEEWLNAQVN